MRCDFATILEGDVDHDEVDTCEEDLEDEEVSIDLDDLQEYVEDELLLKLIPVVFAPHLYSDGTIDLQRWSLHVQGQNLTGTDVESCDALEVMRNVVLDRWNTPTPTSEHSDEIGPRDLHYPLSYYWINSSHNTYLSGNQLMGMRGACSTDAVSFALDSGCRVVELDVYDSSSGPVVRHGISPMTPIPVRDCLEAIQESAFGRSNSPVIITLENHTKKRGQKELARMLDEVFGESLHVPPDEGLPREWPHPGKLQQRILLRDKVAACCEESPSSDADSNSDSESQTMDDCRLAKEPVALITDERLKSCIAIQAVSLACLKLPVTTRATSKTLKSQISVPNLETLKFSHSDLPEASVNESYVGSSSVSNKDFAKVLKTVGHNGLRDHTSRHIIRVYPSGRHIDSSNFDPQDAWEAGCQIVALNFQGTREGRSNHELWLNAGKFRANGGCGYVLKPPHLLPGAFSREQCYPRQATLSVSVLAGFRLEDLDSDFTQWRCRSCMACCDSHTMRLGSYVKLRMGGAKADRTTFKSQKSFSKHGNRFWQEKFRFVLTDVDLAVLSISIWSHRRMMLRALVGQYAFPVSELRPGWRLVPLLDMFGQKAKNCPALLCKFRFLKSL